MHLEEHAEGAVMVVAPVGRLDSATSPDLSVRLDQLADGGGQRLVLDLARVDFVSSAGLRAILSALKRLKGGHGDLALCSVQPPVQEVLEISGFASLLQIHPGRAAAIEALA